MHRKLALLHRWFGLFTATFLFVAGLTGAIIAWDHELDGWLNPAFYRAPGAHAVTVDHALSLAARYEANHPGSTVRYLPLATHPGETLRTFVSTRDLRTHEDVPGAPDNVALDPARGTVQAARVWGAPSLARLNLLPFLYKLHYTLHLPELVGGLFMGVVAIVWTLDGFVALASSFPSRRQWRRSLSFRLRAGWLKALFDVHRSGGVWASLLLITLAVTAVSMNLGPQVVRPLVGLFSPLAPSPYEAGARVAGAPRITREEAVAIARAEAVRIGLTAQPGGLFHEAQSQVYGVGFFAPGGEHGDGGLGNPWLYVSARDGRLLARELPGRGSAGDLFMQAQFPLHSGRMFGLAGRIAITLLGLLVATLSATGLWLWARKRRRHGVRASSDAGALASGSVRFDET